MVSKRYERAAGASWFRPIRGSSMVALPLRRSFVALPQTKRLASQTRTVVSIKESLGNAVDVDFVEENDCDLRRELNERPFDCFRFTIF